MMRETRVALAAFTVIALCATGVACKKKTPPPDVVPDEPVEPAVPGPQLGANPSVDQCRELSEKAFDSAGALRAEMNPDEVKSCCTKVSDSLSPSERSQWPQFDRCRAYVGN